MGDYLSGILMPYLEYSSKFKGFSKKVLSRPKDMPKKHAAWSKYELNPNKLERLTIQKEDYVVWPITQMKKQPPEKYKPGLPFQGDTTYHKDFVSHEGKPIPKKAPKVYKPTKYKLDSTSVHHQDYQKWDFNQVRKQNENHFITQ
jgi:hypothetical protein